MTEIEKAAQAWLEANDWDYQKYGDKRPNRDAYASMMRYEISDLLFWAFEQGANWALTSSYTASPTRNVVQGVSECGCKLGVRGKNCADYHPVETRRLIAQTQDDSQKGDKND